MRSPFTQMCQEDIIRNWRLNVMHSEILETRSILWPDESACADFAQALARLPGLREACIELHGPLGAGKTTFTRHLLRALGVQGRIKSPSYAIVEPYETSDCRIWHFDFYRFGDPREWEDAGFRDIFANPGLKLVEWPDKAGAMRPPADLRLTLNPLDESSRSVRVDACTAAGMHLLTPLIPAAPIPQETQS